MTKEVEEKRKSKIRRRQVLNAAAAGAGLAVGSGLVRGFPTIWAQNIKDITLRPCRRRRSSRSRRSPNRRPRISGFTIEHAGDRRTPTCSTASLSQSSAIDVGDVSIISADIPRRPERRCRPIPVEQVQGLGQDASRSSRRASTRTAAKPRPRAWRPTTVLYCDSDRTDRNSPSGPTEWLTGIPTIYQCRHARHPSRSGRPRRSTAGRIC